MICIANSAVGLHMSQVMGSHVVRKRVLPAVSTPARGGQAREDQGTSRSPAAQPQQAQQRKQPSNAAMPLLYGQAK